MAMTCKSYGRILESWFKEYKRTDRYFTLKSIYKDNLEHLANNIATDLLNEVTIGKLKENEEITNILINSISNSRMRQRLILALEKLLL